LPPAVRPEVIERALIVRFMRRQIHSDVPEPVLPPDTRTRNVQCVLHLQFWLALACPSCSEYVANATCTPRDTYWTRRMEIFEIPTDPQNTSRRSGAPSPPLPPAPFGAAPP
jgi:hypothetical protein